MKERIVLMFALSLVLSCAALFAQTDADAEPVEPPPAQECYGYVGSIQAGGTYTATFCSTGHACKMEVQRALNSVCKDKFSASCAQRTCPADQACRGISLGGGAGTVLNNCAEYLDPNGCGLQGSKLCVCDAVIAARVDCGCQCS